MYSKTIPSADKTVSKLFDLYAMAKGRTDTLDVRLDTNESSNTSIIELDKHKFRSKSFLCARIYRVWSNFFAQYIYYIYTHHKRVLHKLIAA